MIPQEMIIDLILGSLLPALVAIVNQVQWSPRLKGIVSLVVGAAASVVAEWVRGDIAWGADLRDTVIWVLGAMYLAYRAFWRPSTWAATIEAATTPGVRTAVRTPEG